MTAAPAEDRGHVGPYRVIKAIGAGGSARIDLARIDRAYGFQRHVVLKRPLEHLRADPNVAASLRREARIGGQLRHPNLVAILDAGVHDGYDYLVLEYVHGAALRTVMHADAPGQVRELPLAVALSIISDAARGMHEAHELTDEHGSPLGLVHRDVSPGNILIGLDGTVKLADFGIAKETRVSTLSGSMHGTVTYMAPEQCQGHAYDRRADIFSLGVILYELVTGTRLFWADNDVASLHRVLSGTVPRPRKVKPQIASALEDILMTAVAHDATRRYPTALALATALEHHAASVGEGIGARWIARTMERVVGNLQVPWSAAPTTAPQGDAPASEGSLVELIAAAGPDEPVEPTFGDADEVAEQEPPVDAPAPTPRRRRWIAGLVALGVAGAAATALVVTRAPSGQPPATHPAAPVVTAPPPAAAPRQEAPTTAPRQDAPTTAESNEPPPAPPAPDAVRVPTRVSPASNGKPKRRPAVRTTHRADKRDVPDSKAAKRDTPPAPAPAPPPPTAPAPAPAANVEWKPTLLLPTDHADAKAPR